MFWRFFIGLFIASIIAPLVFALLVMPLLGAAMLIFRKQVPEGSEDAPVRTSPIAYPFIGLIFLGYVYVFCGWAAYVAVRTTFYASHPDVSNPWLYYVVGFALCHGPLGYMAVKEGAQGSKASCLHILIAMVAYVVFCLWPPLMLGPYGWFLRWIYN